MANTNLLKGLVIVQGNPQPLDADFPSAVSAFPYIGKSTKGDRAITNSGNLSGYGVRGW